MDIWDWVVGAVLPFILLGILLWILLHGIRDPVSRVAREYSGIHWWDFKKKKKRKLDNALESLGVDLSILDDKQNCMNCSMWGHNLEACGLVREEGGTHCEYWEAVKP